jgi:protein O-mannosyl-transferase
MAGLVLVTVVLYARVATFEFISYDDPDYVTNNPHVKSGFNAESIHWALTSTDYFNWFPLTWLSLELDAQLYGLRPGPFHLTNLALHVGNSVLLFWLLRTTTGSALASAATAALFAIHPLHVESVAWVTERKDVLSTLFWLLTLLTYVGYVRKPSGRRYCLALFTFAVGLTAKQMLVTLPCVMLLMDFWPLGRWQGGPTQWQASAVIAKLPRLMAGRLILEKVPFFALSLALSLTTMHVQREGGAVVPFDVIPLSARIVNVPAAYVAYLVKTAWPLNLAVFYPHLGGSHSVAVAVCMAALLIGMSVWTVAVRNRLPFVTVGWLWFLGTTVPVIGLVQIGSQGIADRYTYVPSIGLFVGVVWGLDAAANVGLVSRRMLGALAVVALTSFAACTWVQVGYWQNDLVLWQHAVDVTGWTPPAADCLGEALVRRGRNEEAVPILRRLIVMWPEHPPGHANLGIALLETGQLDEARAELAEAIRLKPTLLPAHVNLAKLLDMQGDLNGAERELREALKIDPSSQIARRGLDHVLDRLRVRQEAKTQQQSD